MSRTRLALSTAALATVRVGVSCAKTVDTSSGSTRTINTADPVAVGEPGVVPPRVVHLARPAYTRAAMVARIEGTVVVSAVVLGDGSVGDVRVTKSLDTQHGLDAEAVRAARRSTFTAGTKDGRPVPVRVTLTFDFLAAAVISPGALPVMSRSPPGGAHAWRPAGAVRFPTAAPAAARGRPSAAASTVSGHDGTYRGQRLAEERVRGERLPVGGSRLPRVRS